MPLIRKSAVRIVPVAGLAVVGALAGGCLKPKPAQTAAQTVPLRLVTALGSYEDPTVADLPADVIERIGEEVTARNLTPEPVGVFAEAFGTRREVAGRLDVLEEAGIAQPLLLVSCDPRYDTQVNGRFRWSVDCDVALASPDLDDGLIVDTLDAAAHPVYYHQREAAAVSEVSALLARKVGNVLDQWLAVRTTAAPPAPAPVPKAPRMAPPPAPVPPPIAPPPAPPPIAPPQTPPSPQPAPPEHDDER